MATVATKKLEEELAVAKKTLSSDNEEVSPRAGKPGGGGERREKFRSSARHFFSKACMFHIPSPHDK